MLIKKIGKGMSTKIIYFFLLIFIIMPLYSQDTAPVEEGGFDENKIFLDTADNQEEGVSSNEGQFLTVWDFVKVILILAAVIIIIYAIFFFLKKAGGAKYQNNNLIKLLDTQALTQNCSVHIVEVGAKYYLLGCSENTVSHIADIEDKESIDSILINTPSNVSEKKSFVELLGINIGKNNVVSSNISKKLEKNKKNVKDQAERLKKM